MKKLVRTNLTNSPTRRGTENLNIQFYSHDRNNAGFEFVVSNESDLTNYTAKVLFNFTDSASTWEANGTIEGNVIKVAFNTNLIARCEEVLGYLFLDSDSDSLDVFKFKFNVVLSEIDKGEVANRQIKHVNNIGDLELVTRSQLKDELSKLQINGVDLTNYLTTTVADERYAQKQELSSYALSKDVPSINGLITEEQLRTANNGVLEEVKKLGYAKTTEVPAAYNDSELAGRVTKLESRNNQPTVDSTKFITNNTLTAMNFVSKDELNKLKPNQTLSLINKTLSISGGNSVDLPIWEIHGTGMPNGVVEAEIGTTYVDKNKTNGALKWIKTTDGGNTGWEVLIGDTGRRTLNRDSRAGNSFIKIRRVNNLVTYQFGGLQWGWFGVGKRNGPGFVRHNSSGDKGAKLTYPNGIPEGFRSENSLVGPTYDDKGRPYGIWYLGGKSDLNFIQFTFNDPIPTDRDIGDIRVSAISYLTEEPWPVQLP